MPDRPCTVNLASSDLPDFGAGRDLALATTCPVICCTTEVCLSLWIFISSIRWLLREIRDSDPDIGGPTLRF